MKNIYFYYDQKNPKISFELMRELEYKFLENNFSLTKKDEAELCIAVGGDGTFIRMVRDFDFSEEKIFVGLNLGQLGFLQEILIEKIDDFIEILKSKDYDIELSYPIELFGENSHKALNEIIIRSRNFKVIHMQQFIKNGKVQDFAGSAFLFSSPIGSTAENLSEGGCILPPDAHMYQMTPLGGLNSKAYRSLKNSIVVNGNETTTIKFNNSRNMDLIILVDGEIYPYFPECESLVKLSVNPIKILRTKDFNFWKRIEEKFLT